MILTQKIGWHTASLSSVTGVLTLVSSTSGPLDLSPGEAYNLLQFLFVQQELLQALALSEERQAPPPSGGHQE
jgi:hypothetical protein